MQWLVGCIHMSVIFTLQDRASSLGASIWAPMPHMTRSECSRLQHSETTETKTSRSTWKTWISGPNSIPSAQKWSSQNLEGECLSFQTVFLILSTLLFFAGVSVWNQPWPQQASTPSAYSYADNNGTSNGVGEGGLQARDSKIKIILQDKDLWKKFSGLGTEMIITRSAGRWAWTLFIISLAVEALFP